MNQSEFFMPELVQPPKGGRADLTIQERFELFHSLNPFVYKRLVSMARKLRGSGRRKAGIGMLVELLRWNYYMSTTDANSEFKLCNDYRSRYARLIMEQESDLEGFFNTRRLES